MPDNVDDEVVGCIHFADEYTNRYGDLHPLFFQGSLEEAVKEACNKPAKEVCNPSLKLSVHVLNICLVLSTEAPTGDLSPS